MNLGHNYIIFEVKFDFLSYWLNTIFSQNNFFHSEEEHTSLLIELY